jgi:hypothetical protein
MRRSAFLSLCLGASLVTACGDDEARGDAADTEAATGTTASTSPTTTTTAGSDTEEDDDPSSADETGPGCTPTDACREDADCLAGQTCLPNCTCFGQPAGDTDEDDPDSCAGACGVYDESAPCQCDAQCQDFGDCCSDVCDECPSICGGSCAGICETPYDENAPCQCDSGCFEFGDCCGDICTECGDPFALECGLVQPPGYTDCANDGPAICRLDETCLQAEEDQTSWGVCGVPGCSDEADCPDAPESGDAPVVCGELQEGEGDVCYLDCSGEQDCPADMTCTPQGNCAFEGPGFLLYEGFDGGEMPAEWTVVDVDGFTPDAGVSWVTDAWVVTDMVVGDYAAASTSWYDPVNQADDWLISPPIMLGNASKLSWRAVTPDGNFPDGYEVYVSTAGATVADFLAEAPVLTIAAEAQQYTYRSVDLAAEGYQNEEVWIAFRNNSDDMFLLFVDEIAVTQ